MKSLTTRIHIYFVVGSVCSVLAVGQVLADEPTAPSRAPEATAGAAESERGGAETGPPVVEGEPAPPPEVGQVQEQTVSLTQAVHFTDAKGRDAVVGPGSYRLEAEGTNRIYLLPAEAGEVRGNGGVDFRKRHWS